VEDIELSLSSSSYNISKNSLQQQQQQEATWFTSKWAQKVTKTEPETTIIQNITLGYHFVSDINLQFSPREVKDLTWEDPIVIKKSRDLKESLRRGILKQLSEEEYEKTMDLQYQREQKELLREQKNKTKLREMKVGDENMLVDRFDVGKSKKKNSNEVDITGTANHPMSYVTAFEIAQNQAAERGDVITAEDFASIVERDPGIVPKLLQNTRTAANNQKQANAYYATPNDEFSNSTGVVKTKMRNYNQELLGQSDYSYLNDSDLDDFYDDSSIDENNDSRDEDFAEEIIINVDEE